MTITASLQSPNSRVAKAQAATENKAEISTWFYLLGILIMSVGFWYPEHGWEQSKYFADIDEITYDGTANLTADRLKGVDKAAIVSRVSLACYGLVCFWFQRRYRLRLGSPLLWLGLAFGGLIYASVLWSINPSHTIFKLVVLGCMGCAALGFGTAFSLRQLLEWLALTCAVYLCVGVIAEISLGTFEVGSRHRFVGTVHPNTEAIFGAVLCLCARLFYRADRSKLLAVLLFGLAIFLIYLTKSRTTLAAVVVSFAVMQILAARGRNRVYLILICIFAVGCLTASSVLLSVRNTGQIGNIIAMGRKDDVTTLTGRVPLWEELFVSVRKAPTLGYGYLAYWDAQRVEFLSETFSWEIPHGHNMYIDVALDVGLVGACLFVAMLIGALISASSIFLRTGKIEYAIVVGIYICAMINGCGESLFKMPGFPLFVLASTYVALLHDAEGAGVRKVENGIRRSRRESIHENR